MSTIPRDPGVRKLLTVEAMSPSNNFIIVLSLTLAYEKSLFPNSNSCQPVTLVQVYRNARFCLLHPKCRHQIQNNF